MSNLISPHDKLFKITMSRPEVAKEFLQEHLPANIKKLVNLNTLKQESTEFIDETLRGHRVDILYSVHFGHKQGYIYTLFEHLSSTDEMIALRILRYMICVMEWHWKKTNAKVLCPIYPIIVYSGTRKYNASTSFFDLFGNEKKLVEDILLNPFQLLDIKDISDKELQKHIILGLMVKAMLAADRDTIKLAQMLAPFLVKAEKDLEYIRAVIEYVLYTKEVDNRDKFFHELTTRLSPMVGEEIMTIAEQLKQEGMQRGIQQGIQQGMQQGKQEGEMQALERMAIALLNKHGTIMDVDEIAELTGLSKEKIESLRQKITH